MSKRLTGLDEAEFRRFSALLTAMAHDVGDIANSIGPAWGAKWCDEALKVIRKVDTLRLRIEYRFADDHGFIPHVPDPRHPDRRDDPRKAAPVVFCEPGGTL